MIDLTPLDVRRKKGDFRRALRGYAAELVDDFLDAAADRLEELVRENAALTDRVERLDARVAEYNEREQALTEALVSAQEFRQERISQAAREAELQLREARAEADGIRREALRDREREQEALRRARARRAQLVEGFRAFLQRELRQLEVEAAALDPMDETAPDAGWAPTGPAYLAVAVAQQVDAEPTTAPMEAEPAAQPGRPEQPLAAEEPAPSGPQTVWDSWAPAPAVVAATEATHAVEPEETPQDVEPEEATGAVEPEETADDVAATPAADETSPEEEEPGEVGDVEASPAAGPLFEVVTESEEDRGSDGAEARRDDPYPPITGDEPWLPRLADER